MSASALPGRSDERAPGRRWWERFTIRGTLYAGFGLVFVLWVASGLDLLHRMGEVEARASAVSARLGAADQQLSTIRVRVLVASVYLRDALLDIRPNAGDY